jgi:hypothetical protein
VGIETLLGIFADGVLKLPSNSSERYLIMNVASLGFVRLPHRRHRG